jgi:hypothetical protein
LNVGGKVRDLCCFRESSEGLAGGEIWRWVR